MPIIKTYIVLSLLVVAAGVGAIAAQYYLNAWYVWIVFFSFGWFVYRAGKQAEQLGKEARNG